MSEKKKNAPSPALIIGVLGFFAGIALLFTDSWFIGLFGAIASGGVAYKSYQDRKVLNEGVQQTEEER